MTDEEKRAKTPDLLFDFIRDMIYEPNKASLCLDDIDPTYRDVGEGLKVLAEMLFEERRFAEALSRGELQVSVPSRDNELASPLKKLHSILKHLTWQTKRVAAGDYEQRVDFMGEFSESFNSMIRELSVHTKLLQYEIDAGQKKNRALEAGIELMQSLTESIPQVIIVIGAESQEMLYTNQSAKVALESDPDLIDRVRSIMLDDITSQANGSEEFHRTCETETGTSGAPRYYVVHSYTLHWNGEESIAFVIQDVTEKKLDTMKLERLANVDELTKLYVRRYGMEVFEQWISERRPFCLCFIDLDSLKYTNDTFGHDIGDIYITTAARLISELAPGVVGARLGGDEFMALVPDHTEATVVPILEKLENDLAEAQANLDVSDDIKRALRFHASYGVVDVPTDGSAVASDLLAFADKKMYDHKMAHKAARRAT